METITYKCPNCDGGLVFDPGEQKFKCEYCLAEFTEEELKKLNPESSRAVSEADSEKDSGTDSEDASGEAHSPGGASRDGGGTMMVYSCPSCGAEIVADETTAATYCYYCHNPVVLSGRLSGEYRPDYVLPFEMDRKKAEEIFKNWIRRKRYVPKDFYSPRQMELLQGIYYPYWLFSCQVDGRIEAETTRRRVSRFGSVENIETSYYKVNREGAMDVNRVARNALKKADRRLSEAVLPFDMEKLRPFTAGYLSGFQAQRRDVEAEEFRIDVETEIRDFAVETLRSGISGYDSVRVLKHEEKLCNQRSDYVLFPVWILTYKGKKDGKTYYFAMNGQSGKVCGVLPVDYKRLAMLFAAVFFPMLFVFLLGGYLI